MSKNGLGRHYIKHWRKKRGLSLRQLADRLETEPGGDLLLTYASLSRIEAGDQPFTEATLQAIASALGVKPAELLEINPLVEGEVIDLMGKMDKKTKETAIQMLRLLVARALA